jgi:glycosyltransferase involved in cell wall biosynthesis
MMVAPAARGGLARHVVSLLAALCEEGQEVSVVCDLDGPIAEAARDRSVPIFASSFSSDGNPSRAAMASIQLARAVSEQGTRVVHTHSFAAGLTGALAMSLSPGARMVASIHNYPAEADGMRARRRRHRWALRRMCAVARRLIAVSDALRRDLVEAEPDAAGKCVTIPNGVDTTAAPARDPADTRRALRIPPDCPLVGMVARLAPQKGVTDFVRAARQVADRCPSAHLVLAGDGPLAGEARSLGHSLAMDGRLHLLGEMDAPLDLIAALDVLVVASTSEGSSLVAMEAMALSKPVVGTAVGGVAEIVVDGDTGLLVAPGSPAALAEGIGCLLERPERARRMGERGQRRAAAQFDVRSMVERTKAVYADVLRERVEAEGDVT